MAKPIHLTNRFDLDDVIASKDLHEVVKSLALVSGLSTGIVRMPPPGEPLPSDPFQFHLWRLTPVEPVGRPSQFCEEVRKVPGLDVLCMWSDLRFARQAREQGEPILYDCIPAGLKDMVAPVEVAGRHVANIYLGRARPPGSDFETHWQHVRANLTKRGIEAPGGFRDLLRKRYDGLPIRSEADFEKLKPLLSVFAELLSQRANRQVALKVLGQIGEHTSEYFDDILCIRSFYAQCRRILDFDTGSVFLVRGAGREAFLESAHLDWGEDQPKRASFRIDAKKGLIPLVARNAMGALEGADVEPCILCRSRAQMAETAEPGYAGSRDIRGLESFLGVPIECEKQLVGVLEVGSKERNAFSEDDRHLLKAGASFLAVSIRACRDRSHLVTILSRTDLRELLRAAAIHLPGLTNGTGCSIFLRERSDPNRKAVMLASSELPDLVNRAFYTPGEGLTGWVLKTGRVLNLPAGPGARSPERLSPIDHQLKWQRKYEAEDTSGIGYVDKAFLACPIRGMGGDILGVIRIAARSAGDFTRDDERAVGACANALGSVVAKAGIDHAFHEITEELRALRSRTLAGQREILNAIKKSPHAFVILASKVGLVVLAVSLGFFYVFNLTFIDPWVSWFGCFAFASYWLMGKIAERAFRRREGPLDSME